MRVTAVIPLFNKAERIKVALDSVLEQSRPVDEIIVVDDGSTDGGHDIVAAYREPRLRLLRRDVPGAGGYAARNLAISAATAEWMAFLDADDVWQPDHIDRLAALATSWPAAGCLATRFTHVFLDRREPQRLSASLLNGGPSGVAITFDEFLAAWLATRECPLWTGAVAVHREVLTRTGGFPETGAERGGDKDLWLRIARATDIAFSPVATADFYRDVSGKLTDRVDTRRVPFLVGIARELVASGRQDERRLLRGLINQEIELYARWSARAGGRPLARLTDLAWPAPAKAVLTLLASRHVPSSWLRGAHQWEHRRRARRRER